MLLSTSQDAARERLQTARADWLATAQRELMLLAHFFFHNPLNLSPLLSSQDAQSLQETMLQS